MLFVSILRHAHALDAKTEVIRKRISVDGAYVSVTSAFGADC